MGTVDGACNAPNLLSIPFRRPFVARGAQKHDPLFYGLTEPMTSSMPWTQK